MARHSEICAEFLQKYGIVSLNRDMRHPTQAEDCMMAAVMLSVTEEADRLGAGLGCFHGYEIRAVRLSGRSRLGLPSRVCVEVRREGELLGKREIVVSGLRSRQ